MCAETRLKLKLGRSQALPFGGVKDSGFDRFAGIEGLRGCCFVKSVCVDRFPSLMKTNIPPLLQVPIQTICVYLYDCGHLAGNHEQ